MVQRIQSSQGLALSRVLGEAKGLPWGYFSPNLEGQQDLHPPRFAKSRGTLELSIEEGRGRGGGGGEGLCWEGQSSLFLLWEWLWAKTRPSAPLSP